MNLHDLLAIPLQRAPGRTALVWGALEGEEEAWSYRALWKAAQRVAGRLAERGVGHGDRVVLFLGNGPGIVVAYLAILRLGAVAVPLNLAYRRPEIAHVLGDAEPRLLITGREQREVVESLSPDERRTLEAVLLAEELLADATGRAGVPPPPKGFPGVDGSDLALLLYTSGTTGRSKGAMITHDNLLATITGLLAAWGWREDDRLLLTLPLFHTHGLVVGLLTALAAGATVLLEQRFDAGSVATALLGGSDPGAGTGSGDLPAADAAPSRHPGRSPLQPTLFFGVPTLYVRLVDELRKRRGRGQDTTLPHVRLFASGSAPLAPETFTAFRELTGHAILERYGMTETGMNLSNPYAGPRLPGTVGRPLPGVSTRIVDDDGRPVEDGAEGELLVAGSNVFAGYWRDPEKTAEAFVVDPQDEGGRRWFRTGDLARRDPESGHYTLLGRRHDLIITGGYNVYPREVEEALEALPGIREAAVAGLPDRDRGELVAAWLVLEEGSEWFPAEEAGEDEAAEALAARLRERLEDRLADFKRPRRAVRVEALPRNALGKVQKHRLPGRDGS